MKLGIFGCGNMGQALISGVIGSGVFSSGDIYAYDIDDLKINEFCRKIGIKKREPLELAADCDIILLAVKPQDVESLLHKTSRLMDSGKKIVVSIAAGVNISLYRKYLQNALLVRVMPNTPALIGKGASGLYFDGIFSEEEKDIVMKLFISCGIAEIVKNEELLDSVTGLSGSGPAYVFSFIGALADAGVMEGLSRETAKKLAVQTVLGSAELASNSIKEGIHLEELKDRVTSPGGTTAAGLFALEEGAFKAVVINAVKEAANRSRELGSIGSGLKEHCCGEHAKLKRRSFRRDGGKIMLSMIFYYIYILARIYEYVFMIYIILSFFPIDENNFFVRIIRGISEPLYFGLMRFLPPLRISMIDLSPIYVFVFIYIVEFILIRLSHMF